MSIKSLTRSNNACIIIWRVRIIGIKIMHPNLEEGGVVIETNLSTEKTTEKKRTRLQEKNEH